MSGIATLRSGLDRVAFAHELGIEPDSWQQELLSTDAPRVLLNCSRQSGKSTACAILALHRALFHPGSLVLCLSPSLRQSGELFKKALSFYRSLGKPVGPDSETALTLSLANGSRVVSLPGSEGRIRGYSGVALLIIDEASRVDDSLVHSVRPMLAVSGGRLIMASTPWGKRGVFYQEWARGEGWERFEIAATACPRISSEFLSEEQQALPARVYAQEYLCSFEDVEDQFFSSDVIAAMFDEEADVPPLITPASPPQPGRRKRKEVKQAPLGAGLEKLGGFGTTFGGGPFR